MNIEILPVAELEFFEAVHFYNLQSEGLGFEFATEVKRTFRRITDLPNAWHPLSKRTRRCRTNRFPYGVIYQIREDIILVIAIMHLNRNPETWKLRIKKF